MLKKAQQGDFMSMICHVDPIYTPEDFHKRIAKELQNFLNDPEYNKLAIFLPPQHGKSDLTSRKFPPFAFGINPNLRIALASYSSDLANKFNRFIQKIIDSEEYKQIFPKTTINSKNVVTIQSWLRNSEVFEIVDKRGDFKSVGVAGGLSSASSINVAGCAVANNISGARCTPLSAATAKCSGIGALLTPPITITAGALPSPTVQGSYYIVTDTALTTTGVSCTLVMGNGSATGVTATYVGHATGS